MNNINTATKLKDKESMITAPTKPIMRGVVGHDCCLDLFMSHSQAYLLQPNSRDSVTTASNQPKK